jgi:CBS-domain-containing membrane protein
MFLEMKIRRFPVLDDKGNLVGQISQRDVLRAITELKGDTTH